jgi:hypothetical protein
MRKPQIVIKLSPLNYAGLANLGNRAVSSLTGNGNFTTPAVTLVNLQAAITAVEDAIAVWGPKGNRGSHEDVVDLRTKALTLHGMLKAEADYVQTTAQIAAGNDFAAMAAIMVTSGFDLKNIPGPQGMLEAVQNFHRFISRSLAPNQVKLKWKHPLNVTSKSNVKSYRVLRGTTNVFSAAVEIGAPTKTTFIDTNNTGVSQTWFYWVVAVGSAGDSAPSGVVSVIVVAD